MADQTFNNGLNVDDESCDGCSGTGIRSPASPSCRFRGEIADWTVVERCDYCERFSDDFAAAAEVFDEVRWVQCESGGWHALGRLARSSLTLS